MSTDPAKKPWNEVGLSWLGEGEFDFSATTPGEHGIPVGGLEICTTVHEQTEVDCAKAVSTGPAVALRLTVQQAPGHDLEGGPQEFVELLRALNDLDVALGGRGLVLDQRLSAASSGRMTVVLRPLDVRWSLDRFNQMAELLGGSTQAPPVEGPFEPTDNGRIAEVISLYARWDRGASESPRDRVQEWRGQRQWVGGLVVEVVGSRAS